jgi:drug/metabolite transporter (DMT)-like permease
MQLLAGGVILLIASLLTGEFGRLDVARISGRSWLALAYLVVFGSLIAYSAYVWLLGRTAPARVSSHAYVNPVVAVLLGHDRRGCAHRSVGGGDPDSEAHAA